MKHFSKFLAILTTLVLLSCPLFSALADSQLTFDGQVTESQANEKWFYDTTGNRVTAAQLGENNALVQVSKWVQSAGNENEFEVTLNVTTEEDLTTLSESQDAAVLFVLDNSSSMNTAMGNGTRLSTLKEVANTFLNTFANQTGAEPGDQRLAAAVVFNGSATLHMPWLDLCKTTNENGVEKSNLNLAQARIDAIPNGSGTNIEAGMHLAASYMNYHKTAANGKLKNVDFLYTILITDGEPGNCSPYDENYLSQYNGNDNIVFNAASPSTDMGVFDRVDTIGDAAADIKKLSALSEIYGVCMSVGKSNLLDADPTEEQQKKLNPTFSGKIQIGKWFQLFSDKYFSVSDGNVGELENAFGQIASKIQVGTSAFRLKDVMGPHIRYDGPSNASDQNVIEKDGNAFTWDLRKSPREEKKVTSSSTETTIYEYQYKYKTSLNNLAATLTAATATPVNDDDDTRLEYIATKDGRWQTNMLYQVGLPVPTVQGYAAELNFTKHDYTGKPLAGAVFTLSHNKTNCSCGLNTTWEATATSTNDGSVHFSGIPSGHTYSMTEVPPEGHASPGVQTVTTALGEATLTGAGVAQADDGSYTLTNEQDIGKTGKLIIKKTFSGHSEPEGVVFAVEKTTPEGINYSTTVTLNAANSWTVTLQGIPSGTYSVKEQLSDATFENYDHKVTVEVDNQAVTPSTADGFTGVEATVPENGGEVEVHFTNTYTPHTGKVIIRKTITQTGETNYLNSNGSTDLNQIKSALKYVIGDAAGSTVKSLAYSAFNAVSGENYVEYSVELPVGKYTLLETDYKHSRYFDTVKNFSYTLTDGQTKFHVAQGDTISGYITSESLPVYVDKDETVTIHYTNNYVLKAGQLEIRKFFHGIPDELKKPANAGNLSFAYQHNSYETVKGSVAYTSFGSSDSHSAMHGINYRYYLPNAPVGNYTVIEQNWPDYSAQGYRYVKTEYSQQALENFIAGSEGVSSSVQPDGKGTIFFVNTYVPQGKLAIRKQITGDLNDADITELLNTLTFTVKNSSGSVSGTYSAEDAVKGSDGWYTIHTGIALDEGTYTVTETGDSVALFDHTSSVSVASAAANTTANGNAASVTLSHDDWAVPAVVSFTNDYCYQTTSAVLSGSKVLQNRAFLASDSFTFTLTAETSGVPMPDDTSVTVFPAQDASFSFGSISYNKRDVGKSYTYLISETAGSIPGITYDTATYKATVTVSEVNGALRTSTVLKKVDSPGVETAANAIVFTNVYTSKGSLTLSAFKALTGRTLEKGQFSFELRNASGNVLQTVQNAADGSITFAPIDYTEADLINSPFTYTISEIDDEAAGYTYDDTAHTIKVTLTDNNEGGIIATPNATGKAVTFTNGYEASGSISFTAHKTLTGRVLDAGQFSFELVDAKGKVLQTVQNDADGKVSFTALTYTQDDVAKSPFQYTIREKNDGKAGYTYDDTVYNISVTVTDNGDATLSAKAVITGENGTSTPANGESVRFTNAYEAEGSLTLSAKKTLEGRTLADKQFSFILADASGNTLQTKFNTAAGDIVFDKLTFSQADMVDATPNSDGKPEKQLTYTISEVVDEAPGYSYDTAAHTVLVTLVDHGDGTITATADNTGTAVTFTNTYEAEGSATLSAHKVLEGRTLEDEQFSFELKNADGDVLQTVTNAADGSITFAPIDYTEADLINSPFTYTISEIDDEAAGYTYDGSVYTITVEVIDDGKGSLTATPTIKKGEETVSAITFTNTYEAKGSVTLTASKTLTGRKLMDGQFSFELKDSTGNVIETVENDADGNISFSPISYNETDAGKTYTYTVTEVNAGAAGYTYDGSSYTITVKVADAGNGSLTATPTIKKGEETVSTIAFANRYASSGEVVLSAHKVLNGRALAQGQFTFTLTGPSDSPLDSKTNAADGSITFDKLCFTQADMADAILNADGKYEKRLTYQIAETAGSDKGYTYDATPCSVVVTLVDNGDGTITATADNTGTAVTFTNTYKAKGSYIPAATKTLTGRTLADGQFSFQLKDSEEKVLQTVTNDATGNVAFSPINYTEADAGKTHTYTVSEVNAGAAGYTYDGSVYTITVEVIDDGKGSLTATPTIKKGEETVSAITFTNTYEAKGSVTLTASKTLTGRKLMDGQFSFELKDSTGNVIETVENDADGNISFSPISYNETDAGKTYTYTVTEVNAGAAGYTYDGSSYTITVKVADAGNGSLTATPTIKKGEETVSTIAFANSYAASGSATLTASKTLAGRELQDGQFSFELVGTDGQVLQTKTNNATGLITFDALTYEQADVGGNFTYTIREVKGSANGYTYDDTEYTVTVTVKDNGNGTLSAEATVPGEGNAKLPANSQNITFANVYTVTPITYTPKAAKQLTGEEPTQISRFTFTLTADEQNPQGGAQLSGTTATVTGAGEASFGEITFLKAGTYRFTIAENDDGVKGYYYDKASWLLTVVVEDVDSLLTVRSHSYVQQMTEGLASDEKATFTNVFSVTAVPFTPAVTKAVTGVPLRDECHQFTIRQTSAHPDGSVVMPADKTASVTGAGQAVFEEILFLRKGVYTFAITEMAGADPACTYDSSEWTLTVTVTETDSVLSASGAYSCNGQAGDPVFTNHYQPGGLLITKEVTGSQGDRLQPFTFVVNVMYSGEMHDSTYTWQIVSSSGPAPMSGTIANGGHVQLRHGQSVMLYGLPAGASYEVIELEADLNGYVTVAENATGIIAADAAQTVRFFNHCILPDPPTTGDPAQPMLYAVLSLLGLLGLCALRRKRC